MYICIYDLVTFSYRVTTSPAYTYTVYSIHMHMPVFYTYAAVSPFC